MTHEHNFNAMPKGFNLSQAIAEADRCLLCHDAPCSAGCPADTDPGLFIRKFRLKNITGAIRTIKENNSLGGVCGVLCPTDRLCEKECRAVFKSANYPKGQDHPVRIGEIQRFLIEHSWEMDFNALEVSGSRAERIAVVGAGPGGLSCAAELAREGYSVTIFEGRPEAGGVMRYGIASFRLSETFLAREVEEIKRLGVEFRFNTRVEGKGAAENLLKEGFSAVFLAHGLWGTTPLLPEKAGADGLFDSIGFLLSLRDGRLQEMIDRVKGKSVAVIGGGAVAMDCVSSAVRLGARDVFLLYRRSYAQMPAEREERLEALESGVHFLLLNQPVDYLLDASNRVTGVKLIRTQLGEPDASGRRRPLEVEDSHWVLNADIVVEAIGNKVEKGADEWYPSLERGSDNLLVSNPKTGETSSKGIYAGGDIVRGAALVVNAVRDGKVAAKAIINDLNN